MKVEELKIEDLIPYQKNPRKNKAAVDFVANSIQSFGFRQPIVIDKDNVIVCGHTRLLAAKKLKLQTVPCVRADDLTDEEIKAYRLADNKTAEFAEWDGDLLLEELKDLPEIDMTAFGFDAFEEETEIEEGDFPEDASVIEPRVKKGEVYQLGRHRLMCGDSTNSDDVKKLVGGGYD